MEDCADENQLLDQAADGGKYKSYGKQMYLIATKIFAYES
jgi:hypothetical protein